MPGRAIRACCYNHDRHGYLRIAVHRSPAASMVACATHTLTYLWAQAERAARAGRGAPGDHRVQGIARTARDRHRRKDQVALARQLCCRSLRGASTTTTPVTRKSAAGARAAERGMRTATLAGMTRCVPQRIRPIRVDTMPKRCACLPCERFVCARRA